MINNKKNKHKEQLLYFLPLNLLFQIRKSENKKLKYWTI